jgi:hypothetical protein
MKVSREKHDQRPSEAGRSSLRPVNRSLDAVSDLQQVYGNQGVLRLLQSRSRPSRGLPGSISMGPTRDPSEAQADGVAQHAESGESPGNVEGLLRTKRLSAHHARSAPTGEEATTAPASVERALSGSGEPLQQALRNDMEQRFDHDFSSVRVHTGEAAERSARDVGARAYTVGQDIVFGSGQFALATIEGRRLLAHELTHVVQQSGSSRPWLQRAPITPPGEAGFGNQPHALGQAGFGNQPHAVGQAGFGNQPHAVGQAGFGNQPHAVGQAGFGDQPHAFGKADIDELREALLASGFVDLKDLDVSSDPAENIDRFKRVWTDRGRDAFAEYAYELLMHMEKTSGAGSAAKFADRVWDYVWDKIGGHITLDPDVQMMVGIGATIVLQQRQLEANAAADKAFIANFEEQARQYTKEVLKNSELRVNGELARYFEAPWFLTLHGVQAGDDARSEEEYKAARRGLGIAAQGLLRRRNALIKANAGYRQMVHSAGLIDWKQAEENESQASRDYEVFRLQVIKRFPILEEISWNELRPWEDEYVETDDEQGQKLTALAQLAQDQASEDATDFIIETCLEKLRNIRKVRDEIEPGGDIDLWRVPELIQAVRVGASATNSARESELIDAKFAEENRPSNESEGLLAKILLYGGLVLAPFTDFMSMIPYGLYEAGKIGKEINEHFKEYAVNKALHGTDFGAAAIAEEDPSLLWLASDILKAGLAVVDLAPVAAPAVRIFRRLAPFARLAREVQAGEEALAMLKNVAKEAASANLEATKAAEFAEQLVDDARAARAGTVAGMTPAEAQALQGADRQVAAAAEKRTGASTDSPDIGAMIAEDVAPATPSEPLWRIEDVPIPEPAPQTFAEALERVGDIPAARLAELEAKYPAYVAKWKPRWRGQRMLTAQEYPKYVYGLETGRYVKPYTPLEPRFAGDVGRLAESGWANVVKTPRNPGAAQGGRFKTPWGNVEPDFMPAVDASGTTRFARDSADALLIADSKYFGVFSDAVKTIDITDQIRGMIWMAQFTKSRTFVVLARDGQQLSKGILELAEHFGVNVEIRATTVVR